MLSMFYTLTRTKCTWAAPLFSILICSLVHFSEYIQQVFQIVYVNMSNLHLKVKPLMRLKIQQILYLSQFILHIVLFCLFLYFIALLYFTHRFTFSVVKELSVQCVAATLVVLCRHCFVFCDAHSHELSFGGTKPPYGGGKGSVFLKHTQIFTNCYYR